MNPLFLTIHCAATPEGRNVKAEQVEAWDRARFNQPSYHWVIELDGHCHRSLQDDVRGAHVAHHNTGNIGVCYVGGCDAHMKAKDTRTPAQEGGAPRPLQAIPGEISRHQDPRPPRLAERQEGLPQLRR
jgi:hypothetical protein